MTSPKTVTPDQPQAAPDMPKLFYVCDEGPSRFYATLGEAMADGEEQIAEFRKDANADGEWSSDVEDIRIFECDHETPDPAETGRLVAQAQPQSVEYHMLAARPVLPVETPAVDLLDDTSLRARIGEIGDQVHNLGCEHQDDDNLSDRLANLAYLLWALAQQAPTLPVETPAEGLRERPKTKEWKAVHGRSIANDCWFVKVYPLETEANAVAAKAAILAACANTLTQDAPAGIKVKPIEWGENGYAETPIGTYVLELDHDADGGPSHIGVELRTPFVELHWIKTKSNPTWDEAKAAAQADYDRRICSTLASTAPAPLSGRDGSLREALEKLHHSVKIYQFTPHESPESRMAACDLDDAMDAARAALAAVPPETAEMEGDRLPAGHTILEQADMMDQAGRVAQTVRIEATGAEYQRIVHADEAYGDDGSDPPADRLAAHASSSGEAGDE